MFDEEKKIPAYVVGDGKCLPKAVALAITFYASKENVEQFSKWERMIRVKVSTGSESYTLICSFISVQKSK